MRGFAVEAFAAMLLLSSSLIAVRSVLVQSRHAATLTLPAQRLSRLRSTARHGSSSRSNTNTISDSDKVLLVKVCRSAEDIELLGKSLAPRLQTGDVIFLNGDLGAGKTTLSRGIIRSKFEDDHMVVTSPSYLLDNSYQLDEQQFIHHMDLYRLPNGADLSMLGVPQIYEQSICLIEWPERISEAFMPQSYLTISISVQNEQGSDDECRTVTFSSNNSAKWASKIINL